MMSMRRMITSKALVNPEMTPSDARANRQHQRQHPDIERHPTAINDPAQHVAPEHVRPQRMLPVGQRHGHLHQP